MQVSALGRVGIWAHSSRLGAGRAQELEAQGYGAIWIGGSPVDYLDALDAERVPKDQRALAALGPRALRLAAGRTLGAHPYLTTPEHTREAREILGAGVLLAPEQKLVGHGDAATAATRVREHLDAGADHVAIQVLAASTDDALRSYAELSEALGLR